ncbi:MAG: MFS transporter [Steroidobacteraceae bacterium]
MSATRPASPPAPAWSIAGLDGRVLTLVALCSITYFLDCLIPALMGPLGVPIAQSLSLDRTQLGAVFSANLVGQCVGLVTVPLAARRLGHRQIILWMTFGFGVVQLLTTFVTNGEMLLASRFVAGVFLGGALPSGLAAVTQGAPPARRGLATMLLFTGYGLGGAAAGFLASLFMTGELWRHAFAVTGGACLVASVVIGRWLVEPAAETNSDSTEPARRRLRDIVSPPLLGGTLLLWLMFACALTIYYCLSSWLPTLLVDIGRSPRIAALAVGSYTSGGVLSGLLMGPLIDRFGATRILVLFFGIAAASLLAIAQWMTLLDDTPLLTLLAGCGFFMLGGYGGLNVVLAGHYPASLRATGIGWTKSVSRLGTVLPPLAVGYALTRGTAPELLVASFALPAIAIMLALGAISSVFNPARRG